MLALSDQHVYAGNRIRGCGLRGEQDPTSRNRNGVCARGQLTSRYVEPRISERSRAYDQAQQDGRREQWCELSDSWSARLSGRMALKCDEECVQVSRLWSSIMMRRDIAVHQVCRQARVAARLLSFDFQLENKSDKTSWRCKTSFEAADTCILQRLHR